MKINKNMQENPNYVFPGISGIMEVYEDRVVIKPKGLLGKLGGQGHETIFISDITSVEARECSFSNGGHIQISAPGTKEKNNRVEFGGWSGRSEMNKSAIIIKDFILDRMKMLRTNLNTPASTISDEIVKLSKLKEQGFLSETEFTSAKNKLLGI